jgi:hypothetical protein
MMIAKVVLWSWGEVRTEFLGNMSPTQPSHQASGNIFSPFTPFSFPPRLSFRNSHIAMSQNSLRRAQRFYA